MNKKEVGQREKDVWVAFGGTIKVIALVVAMPFLSVCGGTDNTSAANCGKSLGMQRERYMELMSEFATEVTNELAIVREAANTGTIKQRLMRFSCVLDCQKKVAAKYVPLIKAARAEAEATVVPNELLESKGALLSEMDGQIDRLIKFEGLELEETVDAAMHSERKERKDDSVVHDCIPVAVSILPNLEFPSKEKSVCGIRINVVGGSHVDVAWMDLGGVFNYASRETCGVQFAGVCNVGPNVAEGIQFAGLANGCESLVGLQGAAGCNIAGEGNGVQMSGLLNFSFKMRGCQISCCGNYAPIGNGCQVGWSNIAEKMNGIQLGGGLNAGNDLEGLQLAAFNWAGRCRGVQIGAVNRCEEAKGLQIGVVNYADAVSGCQIGAFNVIATSSVPFLPIFNMNF